ncbi:MAG: AraC family transcriptional regulator [Chromatiales bacterium]|nr:AraC family transcriptional regulator [Chromatiales bacterium]
MDVFDDTLRSLRISGSLLLRESYTPPWAIRIPNDSELAKVLQTAPGTRVVAFHLVEFGQCAVRPEGQAEIPLSAGRMVICFGGQAHELVQGETTRSLSIETLLRGGPNLQSPDHKKGLVGASLLCGVFLLHNTELNPLFEALPPVLQSALSRAGELHNLAGVARLITDEMDRRTPGGPFIVERLLEVLCAEALRTHLQTVGDTQPGWFRGIRDPAIGRAISAVHADPGHPWSVKRLAQAVAMSPSRFAARFTASIGESPMVYVTKWRMNLACRRLATEKGGVERIAASLGYENQAAFSRAFKKWVGQSPASWRAGQQSRENASI